MYKGMPIGRSCDIQLSNSSHQLDFLQALLHESLSELFKEQPEDPLAFLIAQLQAEQERRAARKAQ
jgi:hypothetical protein